MKKGLLLRKSKYIIAAAFAVFMMLVEVPGLSAQISRPVEEERPLLSVMPEMIDLGTLEKTAKALEFIEISNRGKGKIKWIVKRTEPWLSLSAYSGIVGDDINIISIMADPSELSPGLHRSEIVITSSGGNIRVPVSVVVSQNSDDEFTPRLERIRLSGATRARVGTKVCLRAFGVYSDGSTKDITGETRWISNNKKAGDFAEKGLFVGKQTGEVSVFAMHGGVKSPVIPINIDAFDGPVLKVSLPTIRTDHINRGTVENIPVTLRNSGRGDLEWEIISDQPWLMLYRGIHSDAVKAGKIKDRQSVYDTLRGRGQAKITVVLDTSDLPDGSYEGTILIKSNGGDEKITLPVTVRSLESIFLTPVSVKTTVNHKTLFKTTGKWSDGSRTDLSGSAHGRWILSDPSIGFFPRGRSVFVAKKPGSVVIRRMSGEVSSNFAVVDVKEDISGPVLSLSPREVDLGTIGPGETATGVLSLKNVGSGNLTWVVTGMGSWVFPPDNTLSAPAGASSRRLKVSLGSAAEDGVSVGGLYDVWLRFEAGHRDVSYKKLLPPGNYREKLKLSFNGGERTVFLKFVLSEREGSRSCMEIKPLGIDFGSVNAGMKLVKRIELKNTGNDVLKWKAMPQSNRKTFRGVVLERGRYVSFVNESVPEKGRYAVPPRLENELRIAGKWYEDHGYPYCKNENTLLKYTFSGKGIALFLWKDIDGGMLDVFVDGRMVGQVDCGSEKRTRIEFPVAENLPEGEPHLLVLAGRGGRVVVEGVRIHATGLMRGGKDWIRISPEKGTTTNEIDYVNVTLNTADLPTGSYSENLIFYSSDGVETVEVSLDIISDKALELIDIYRYTKGADSLLSTEVNKQSLLLKGYKKSGPVFRLFQQGTPGTAEFFQWHNPAESTHYYSYSRSGGKRTLKGYVFDGAVGNIATLKLARTKDLYRWFNPETNAYFYTTDPRGEGRERMGYRYDGVAGYVR